MEHAELVEMQQVGLDYRSGVRRRRVHCADRPRSKTERCGALVKV